MASTMPTLRLLQCEVDDGDEDSHLRLLYRDKLVKYVTIAAGVYTPEEMCFEPRITALLEPLLPKGTWNYSYIAKDPTTGLVHFTEAVQRQLPGVISAWHPTMINYLDLKIGPNLKSGVYDVTCSAFEGPVIAKFAVWEWEIDYFNHECAIYQNIEGHGIGPRFLGHITEEGRVIGFLTELVTDQAGHARHATSADLDICRQVLARLHNLGILHGDINKHNFLITSRGATLIDFSEARHSADESAFEEEMRSVEEKLSDISGLGRPFSRSLDGNGWPDDMSPETHVPGTLSTHVKTAQDENEGGVGKGS